MQGAECAVQARGNAGSKQPSKPDDRRAHAGGRRRVARTIAPGTAGGVCRRDLLANQPPPLPVPGGDDPVSDVLPLPGPLSGLRVLELADQSGQFCGKLLGGLGADVIQIEPPGGEPCRRIGPFLNDIPHPERSLSFWYYNTSKRGITLDINTADGRDLFRRLAAIADVVLETFRPNHLSSLCCGYATLSQQSPGLILCSLTPFGQTGPWRDYLSSTCCIWPREARWPRPDMTRQMSRTRPRSLRAAAMPGTSAAISPTWRSWRRWCTGRFQVADNI